MTRNWLLVVLLPVLLACSQTGQVNEVKAPAFEKLLNQTPHKIVLDARTNGEVEQG
ncbi:MAG: hypothetical protein H7319_07515 [Spirosoma sp.]|nr:hypothetical protein [Spirosoma sp.]